MKNKGEMNTDRDSLSLNFENWGTWYGYSLPSLGVGQ